MGKSIIIAEKPSIGKEYARILGVPQGGNNGYFENEKWIVTWTIGHLVTMSYPEKYDSSLKEWTLETLPFIPKQYKYEPIADTYKQFMIIKQLYNRSDIKCIYYAGDSGREGLYIQMLVRMLTGHNSSAMEKVVWIHSQTEEEVLRGIAEAKDIKEYSNMQDSGYMRAIEDYIGGINFSRLLSVKYAVMLNTGSGQKSHKPISIGRVMTCVLGMVVKREREIRDFVPKTFYRVAANISLEKSNIECEWKVTEKSQYYNSPKLYSEFGFLKESDAQQMIAELNNTIHITEVIKTKERKKAPLLYSLPELQAECTKKLHISPSETLKIAQELYEMKYITYPRTDARVLSQAIAKELGENLRKLSKGPYGKFVDEISINNWTIGSKYVDDSKITDHYAIIPTGNIPIDLSEKKEAVYDIICKRFLATFYPPAEYERIKFEGFVDNEYFSGTSKCLVSLGFYKVSGVPDEEQNSKTNVENMNLLQKGENYSIAFATKKGETIAPKRYTTGSMILAMENAGTLIEDDELREQIKKNGVGTPATRDSVLEKLQRLNYIVANPKTQILTPSNFGEMIYEVVDATIPSMLSPEVTAEWEKGLEQIEKGEISKSEYESRFYDYVRKTCESIKNLDNKNEIMARIKPYLTSKVSFEYKKFDAYNTKILCPLCGDEVETTRWGFKCKSNVSKTEGCNFLIGDICGHRLLTPELAELLSKKSTGPFYDFISEKGKIFGAKLLWDDQNKKVRFEFVEMPWEETEYKCPICNKTILKRDSIFKCQDNIDFENGCAFRIGKVMGKSISERQIKKLLEEGQTELIQGFKKDDSKFDAFLIWDKEGKRVKFRFPEDNERTTGYSCPNCGGRVLATPYGYKCEHYRGNAEATTDACTFAVGTYLGHKIKDSELQTITSGGVTELISFKNKDKKEFQARLFWNKELKKLSLKFDENTETELDVMCPICNSKIIKSRYGYRCSKNNKNNKECDFYIGEIAGVLIDEVTLKKLLLNKKTDLIQGFKSKEKGKKTFSAYLAWDDVAKKILFEFPGTTQETSNYYCPSCRTKKLIKGTFAYKCECGFRCSYVIAENTISEEQFQKLFVRGETDIINGFYSARTRKIFSAKLVVKDKEVTFQFPDKET